MKTIIFLVAAVLAICPRAQSQCTEPFPVPYTITSENVTVPALPDCMSSVYNSFASNEIFKTTGGPVNGFTGNVLSYDTTVNTEFGTPPESTIAALLISHEYELTQGISYIISYKYGISDSQKNIDNLYTSVGNLGEQGVFTHEHENITGTDVVSYTSEPFTIPETKTYRIFFSVYTAGTQGTFYLDDISIQESSAMAVQSNSINTSTAYPNPVSNVLHLSHTCVINKADIYNISGQLVQSYNINSLSADINMQQYTNGIYIVAITSDNKTENIKIVKQ